VDVIKPCFYNYNQQDANIFDYLFLKGSTFIGRTSVHDQEHITVHSASGIVN